MVEPVLPQVQLSPSRRRLFKLIAFVGVVCITCLMAVAAEFAVRYRETNRSVPPDYVPSIYYPHRRLRYGLIPNFDYYGWFRINSLGFRGREFSVAKPPGTLRIVCLGGSTTFDIGSIGKDRPWPEVMEQELRKRLGRESIEVLNLGIPGATSLDSLIDLQMRALTFQADVVIVYQSHNDFIYSVPPSQPVRSDLFPMEDRPRGPFKRWLTLHSLLYAKSQDQITDLFGRLGRLVSFQGTSAEPAPDREAGLNQGLAAFRSNLRSIAAIARANGTLLVVPDVAVPIPKPDAKTEDCQVCAGLSVAYGGLPLAKITTMFSRYNDVISEVGQEPGAFYVPAKDFVPAADRFYHDSVHFGPEGSRQMGERLAEALVPVLRESAAATVTGAR